MLYNTRPISNQTHAHTNIHTHTDTHTHTDIHAHRHTDLHLPSLVQSFQFAIVSALVIFQASPETMLSNPDWDDGALRTTALACNRASAKTTCTLVLSDIKICLSVLVTNNLSRYTGV